MRRRDRGVIVQVGSALAYRPIPPQAAYYAAKHAVEGSPSQLAPRTGHPTTISSAPNHKREDARRGYPADSRGVHQNVEHSMSCDPLTESASTRPIRTRLILLKLGLGAEQRGYGSRRRPSERARPRPRWNPPRDTHSFSSSPESARVAVRSGVSGRPRTCGTIHFAMLS
jgi:NAD(P)-dependent dehydrogenase (short-subunit alcohol dehydrogenase family)